MKYNVQKEINNLKTKKIEIIHQTNNWFVAIIYALTFNGKIKRNEIY